MTFAEILPIFLTTGARIKRTSEPNDWYEIEGGKYGVRRRYHIEGYRVATDENWGFTIDQIAATDWEVVP